MQAQKIISLLKDSANPKSAALAQRFFKTGPGEYSEGDIFLGVSAPKVRKIIKPFRDIPFAEVKKLLSSPIHEIRWSGLLILAEKAKRAYKLGDSGLLEKLANFYFRHRKAANNWDLIDTTTEHVLGPIFGKDSKFLMGLASSPNLWDRRMAVLTTFFEIRRNNHKPCIQVCTHLLNDEEDLIHKACGWLLREVGKRDVALLRQFLKQYAGQMPRTMLRYSIEKFSATERKRWLRSK